MKSKTDISSNATASGVTAASGAAARAHEENKELTCLLCDNNEHIICPQETKLNQNLRFNIKDYTTLRMDRPGKFGGGLAVLIKTLEIKFKEIAYNQSKPREGTTEVQAIEIYLTGLIETLSEASSDIAILLGDFNAERPTWGSPVQDNKELSSHIDPYPPVEEARKIAIKRTLDRHAKEKMKYDSKHRTPQFEVGDIVLVKAYHHPNSGHKNIVYPPLIDSENIYLPPLHIKLGLMKNFVKAMDRNASGIPYLKQKCSSISDAKIKEGIFVGPQIRELLQDGNFQNSLNEVEAAAWNSFRNVFKNFLGSVKVENYRDIVNDLLLS
ncbi:hypothetical protein LAZ67_9003697 [Cordylochernes scorpioides]|uniref:Uncharacterized protein n=1 Tax=Cordylochernes scorpioides TaxID=51811 RepID=A0ABY6KUM7_9ARAC|nr:hypothetical protein LAZ67_9003697 [Cordylochernes scorpioides]